MNGTNYEVPHCGAFSTPHSHPSWAQIFASGSCFQILNICQKLLHVQVIKKIAYSYLLIDFQSNPPKCPQSAANDVESTAGFTMCEFLTSHVLVKSLPFCMTLDLQLNFYRHLSYNSRAHCLLLQCLLSTSAILAGAYSYFVVSSFKCERKYSCYEVIPNFRMGRW